MAQMANVHGAVLLALHLLPAIDKVLRALGLERVGEPRQEVQAYPDRMYRDFVIRIPFRPREARLDKLGSES